MELSVHPVQQVSEIPAAVPGAVKKPYLAILRVKVNGVLNRLRKEYFRLLGLNIKEGGTFGKITCVWPQQVTIGSNCTLQDRIDFRIGRPFSKENHIKIGNNVFIGRSCEFNSSGKITVGNDVKIGSSTVIVDVGHETSSHTTINKQPVTVKDITIGDDVWLGTKCTVLQGVTIGRGSVVGAGSVVNKSIPDYEIWAGCPARFIKKRN
ncbi:MAG: acyltransferase [Bacteroidota bacterium]